MAKLSRSLFFIIILCMTLLGCSTTNNPNRTISTIEDSSVEESQKNKVSLVSINEISPLKEGTRVEISWAFPYVRYNGRLYQIDLDTIVEKGKVEKKLGTVERFLSSSMVVSDKPFKDKDGDSNYLPEGSLIYAFSGEDVMKVIVVDDKGTFKKAMLYGK